MNTNILVMYTTQDGDTAYAIRNVDTGLYFIWSYYHHGFAQYMCERVSPGNQQDIECNWRSSPDKCVVSERDSPL